ncbi:VanW family protein [Metabacillus niabensis]|uniref:Vancomycin resistance protein YoaR n=1 Tax=Metabacillus niabensis TaxID=324854 RepID=A0ABT9Z804_9BACI|nr:VanW family protein [Metabacillus niabensis]MDQ0227405.1 vancomycin resistance protein YoaR [Metabacillus niabensis]
MYKKYVSSILLLLMVSGCSTGFASGSKEDEPLSVKAMGSSTFQLAEKSVEFNVDLLHPTTKEVLYSYKPTLAVNSKEYEQQIKTLADELASKLDQPMVPVKLSNGQLTKGQSRVVLDEDKLVESLKNIRALDKSIVLPIEEKAPNVTQETVKGIDEVVIGSYKTTFNASIKGRTHNIALSAGAINQIVLGPGDRFYYNLVVGERTPERGYQKAMEIVDKEFVEGIGGGICQTSSTLYNAVMNAGLEVIEVHSHSRSVGYVPTGKDATVSWNGPDFKFINNKDYPVMIKTIVDTAGGSIEVQILTSKEAAAKL